MEEVVSGIMMSKTVKKISTDHERMILTNLTLKFKQNLQLPPRETRLLSLPFLRQYTLKGNVSKSLDNASVSASTHTFHCDER